jgi:hypothetical protein
MLFVASLTFAAGSIYRGFKLYWSKKDSPASGSGIPRPPSNLRGQVISDNFLSAHMDGAERVKIIRQSVTAPEESQIIRLDISRKKAASETKVGKPEVAVG